MPLAAGAPPLPRSRLDPALTRFPGRVTTAIDSGADNAHALAPRPGSETPSRSPVTAPVAPPLQYGHDLPVDRRARDRAPRRFLPA
jgi:hypothetical protein